MAKQNLPNPPRPVLPSALARIGQPLHKKRAGLLRLSGDEVAYVFTQRSEG
jgi:hypothetical protein